MFYKKTLVLSSVNGGNEKAVVNIEYEEGELVGSLKLYNFKEEPEGILTLGILEDNDVIKAGLTKTSSMRYDFKLNQAKELDSFSCALVKVNKGTATALLHGATNGAFDSETKLIQAMNEVENCDTVNEVKKVLDDNHIELEDQEEIEQNIDECLGQCGEKCSSCEYRHAFFTNETPEKKENKNETFFDGVKEHISELFDKYPEEEFLGQIIPNSKWVKVDYEENGNYYVVGLMNDENGLKYVCYGVPGIWEENPPKELNGYCQWLPLDSTKPKDYGYWMTYQDVENGESVKIDFNVV